MDIMQGRQTISCIVKGEVAFRENAQSIKENIPKLWLVPKKEIEGEKKEKICFGFETGLTLYSRLGCKSCSLSWP